MLVFKSLKWKNFLSTGNSFNEVFLDRYDTTLISGENGAGKSTMLDALTFVLYGKSFRGINIKNLVNSVNERDSVVEVEFTISKNEYRIVRGQKPKIFEIHKNGELMNQDAKVKDYQQILEDQILKMSFKAFCQVVILGSSNYVPFMRLPVKDRKIIVENLLDINIFSDMSNLMKAKVSENKDKLTILKGTVDNLSTKIDANKQLVIKLERKSKESKDRYLKEISRTKDVIEPMKAEVEECNREIEEILEIMPKTEPQDSLVEAKSIRGRLGSKLKEHRIAVAFYDENDHCPTCSQKIDENHKLEMTSDKRNKVLELEKAVSDIESKIDELKEITSTVTASLRRISDLRKVTTRNSAVIQSNNEHIGIALKHLDEVESGAEDLEKEKEALVLLTEKYGEHDGVRRSLIEERTDLEDAHSLLKDTGIKSNIIKYYLPLMNKVINQYLTSMNFFCQFTLDENFDETIKSRHRDEFTYFNFSEGERLRIDLSLLLAWREVARMKNSVNCNLLILDEIFDSSLDSVGTEEFMGILDDIGNKANIFVITHKADQMMDKFQNNIHFKKKGIFSEMEFKMHKAST